VLTSTRQGGSPVQQTKQTGLGGGGQKPFSASGKYSFAVTTTCTWTISAGPIPKVATSTTTTTAPKKAKKAKG